MYSVIRATVLGLLLAAATLLAATDLRVCADPNNLPYSDRNERGFENALAQIVARDLNMTVSYFWFPQGHKFFSKTLLARECDVVMEVPTGVDFALTTQPYYRSTYVFISDQTHNLSIRSFDDERLRNLKIGVHVMGEEDDQVPPAVALIRRGLTHNLVGYNIFGKLSDETPAANLVRAVSDGSVDIAVVWGPLGGFFAKSASVPLQVIPVCSAPLDRNLSFTFAIAMGVRRADTELRDRLNAAIDRHHEEIEQVLRTYGVPLVSAQTNSCE